jgi:alkanesulfonate monooxygenase SsuD/methylene tetrahydromethanopterin reductase-like flavin-dependent oxidoreductase (luciferase family)
MRLAEEVATVDQISHGRLIFGVGRSGFPRVYEAYGIPYAESQERFAETLEIVKRAWADKPLVFSGKYFSFNGIPVTPKPYSPEGPEIRIAINSPDSFPAAGKQGLPIFGAVRLGTLSELGPNLRIYREAYKAAGHPGHGRVYLRLPLYIAETRQQAREEPEESVMNFYRWLGGQLEASATRAGARAIEQRAERGQRLQMISYDDALRDKVVVGTPEMVIDRLIELREQLGLDGILAEMNCGSLIPHERVMNSLRLLCEKVMPRLSS